MSIKYKLVVCDLDGTLLNSAEEISQENKKAVNMLKDAGIEFAIATGRHDLIAAKYIYDLDIKTPLIACNGALIKDVRRKRVLYEKLIPSDIAARVINYCKTNYFDYLVYTPDAIYYSEDSQRVNVVMNYNKSVKEELRAKTYKIRDLDISRDKIIKILIASQEDKIIEKLDNDINQDNSLTIVSSGNGLIDIMRSGASKGNALLILCDKLGILPKETVVFGDSHNDISMFEVAGLAIAPENAEEEVKKAADYVTLSNDMSGVAHAIMSIIEKAI